MATCMQNALMGTKVAHVVPPTLNVTPSGMVNQPVGSFNSTMRTSCSHAISFRRSWISNMLRVQGWISSPSLSSTPPSDQLDLCLHAQRSSWACNSRHACSLDTSEPPGSVQCRGRMYHNMQACDPLRIPAQFMCARRTTVFLNNTTTHRHRHLPREIDSDEVWLQSVRPGGMRTVSRYGSHRLLHKIFVGVCAFKRRSVQNSLPEGRRLAIAETLRPCPLFCAAYSPASFLSKLLHSAMDPIGVHWSINQHNVSDLFGNVASQTGTAVHRHDTKLSPRFTHLSNLIDICFALFLI